MGDPAVDAAPAADPVIDGVLDRSLTVVHASVRESAAWLCVWMVGAFSRFADLGTRAMGHDESMHAMFGFQLLNAGLYRHDPVYHGPLLYHLNALVYWLAGASDTTARIAPAFAGIGLMVALAFFRPYLGRFGAWMAAVLVLLSPTLLFYSRYLREDIYATLFTLLWVYGVFRYLVDRRRQWLVLVTVAMALSFLAKETSFIFGAIVGTFCAGLFGQRLVAREERWRDSAAGDLAVLMATLVLPFTASLGLQALGWRASDPLSTGLLPSATAVTSLFVVSGLVAGYWFWPRRGGGGRVASARLADWVRLMALFWGLETLFFTTFFTNVRHGLSTGVVGSLGYWLGQHEVARGGQPWFYYLLLGGLYEFLPLTLGAIASAVLVRRLGAREWDPLPRADIPHDTRTAQTSGVSARGDALNRREFLAFCVWWAAASWVAYAVAGEKMPWLLAHQILPLCMLGGWWLARVFRALDWKSMNRGRSLIVVGGSAILIILAGRLLHTPAFAGRELTALGSTMRWTVTGLVVLTVSVVVARQATVLGRRYAVRLAFAGVVALAAMFTARAAVRLTYANYDLATELLVYAHATPDIKRAMAEIEVISERTAGGHALEVSHDDESTWPLSWYLREYPNTRFYGFTPTLDAMAAPVIIVGPKNAAKVWPFVERAYVRREYRLIWWPIQDYSALTWTQLGRTLADPGARQRLWQIVAYRRYPGLDLAEWPYRKGFTMYVRRDVAQQAWPLNPDPALAGDSLGRGAPIPELGWARLDAYAGVYAGTPLRAPTALAVAPDGARVVADSGNDRILVLARDGTLRLAFGSSCSLERNRPACIDPDREGPLELGDGQFNEPWGVAVSRDGHIYVADTWNGRIQVFDARGHFLGKWGQFGQITRADPAVEPRTLFGPRGLAFDVRGDLLVADTGNKRILRVGPDGEPREQIGGPGAVLGRFAEPVGLALGPSDGNIYVADAWNRRVQRLDRDLRAVAEWPVPSWDSRAVLNKPYIAVDAIGRVYVSDPEHARVLVYGPDGGIRGSLGTGAGSRPLGVALDPGAQLLLVADHANHSVLRFKVEDEGSSPKKPPRTASGAR